ncbi:MAG: HD domain-containing protein, partial [Pseudomonadota bacterium]
ELDRLFGVPQVAKHHPEIDCGEHVLLVLDQGVELDADVPTRFALLCHDLGKGTTEASSLPQHIGHEARGVPLTEQSCARLKVPNAWRDLALITTRWHSHSHRALELRAATLVDFLSALDVRRRPERFEQFLLACTADQRGRLGMADRPYPQADYLRAAAAAMLGVDVAAIVKRVDPAKREQAIRSARIDAIRQVKKPSL